MRFHIPIELPSLPNARLHWTRLLRLKAKQRRATRRSMSGKPIPPLPLTIILTRVGPRKLDDDNLQGACKYVRDQIAETIGVDDGSPLYTWKYDQRIGTGEPYGLEVEIQPRGDTMIRRDNGELVAECTECGAEFEGGTLEFADFIEDMKENGWKIRKDGDEWQHFCPECLRG